MLPLGSTNKLYYARTSGQGREYLKLNWHNFHECRYKDVIIEKMFSILTERNGISKPEALIHIFNTCCLRIFCFAWPIYFYHKSQEIEVLMFCCWSFIRISNWNDSIWRPGRICGAQRRKFVKNRIGPKWRTSFEVWN